MNERDPHAEPEAPPGTTSGRFTESMEIEVPTTNEDCPMETAFAPHATPFFADASSEIPQREETSNSTETLELQRSSSLFLRSIKRSDIEVYAFGCGSEGQLGVPAAQAMVSRTITETASDEMAQDNGEGSMEASLESVPVPQLVQTLQGKDIIGISAGAFHSVAVTSDGELYAWGANDIGQLGIRNCSAQVDVPTRVEALDNVSVGASSCGFEHTIAIAEDGSAYAWGRADAGQLGIGFGPPQQVERPKPISKLKDKYIARASAGEAHTLFLDAVGGVYATGDGSSGALGLNRNTGQEVPRPILRLWPLCVCQISAGDGHSAALTIGGAVFTWGRGKAGQLGHGKFENLNIPTAVKALATTPISQISCGGDVTIAVSESDGVVWSFGQGRWGATGLMQTESVCIPQRMKGLEGKTVIQASAGGRHTLLLTADNQVLATGCNENGQCGEGSVGQAITIPRFVSGLPSQRSILFVAAGHNHSIVVTEPQFRTSFDASTGPPRALEEEEAAHSSHLPRYVENVAESMHDVLRSTLSSRIIYGERWLKLQPPPSLRRLCGRVASRDRSRERLDEELTRDIKESIERTFATPAALLSSLAAPGISTKNAAAAVSETQARLATQELERIDAMEAMDSGNELPPWQRHEGYEKYYEATLALQNVSLGTAISPWALDVDAMSSMYQTLLSMYDPSVVATLGKAMKRLLDDIELYLKACFPPESGNFSSSTTDEAANEEERASEQGLPKADDSSREPTSTGPASPYSPSNLHPNLVWIAPTLFILLQSPLLSDAASYGDQIVSRMGRILASSVPASQRVIVRRSLQSLLSRLPSETLVVRCARPVNRFITTIVDSGRMDTGRLDIMIAGVLLDVVRQASVDGGDKVPVSEFYNQALSRAVDLQAEYMTWVSYKQKAPNALVSICQMPFLLDPEAKSNILRGEAAVQKQHHMSAAAMQAFFQGLNPAEAGFLRLAVRRTNVVEDALNGIVMHLDGDLKKPLKVTFVSAGVPEPAQDEGGVRKEFFQLVCRDLFRPEFGMFVFDESTRTFWFNASSLETESEFALVGALLGLAIYNNVLLDVHFPMVLYKKLLGGVPTFEDLKSAFPELGKGLQALLDYRPAEDVESVFCRTFEVEYEFWGEIKRHELIPGGVETPVTGENRQQYVDEYTKWVLSKSIEVQFRAFARGFLRVAGGPALTMFAPSELELLICGLPHLDFDALEKSARYEGGYSESSDAVKWLWKAVRAMTLEQKRLLLVFVTGSDRAPIGGLGALELLVQRAGPDTDRLPTSHTCFNALLLPEYSSFDKLNERLLTAISNAQGFGLQ